MNPIENLRSRKYVPQFLEDLRRKANLTEADAWKLQTELISGGSQTLSKRADRYVEGVYPKLLSRADGCIVETLDGNSLVDYICSLGPIILGYNHPSVNGAVISAIRNGQVILSLPSQFEGKLAYKLRSIIPSAEQSRFFKTGSDVCSAAIRAARAYTGRSKVAVCGYHGWHDWFVATHNKAGVPSVLSSMVDRFTYNDIYSLEKLLASNEYAAVMLEPIVYDAPRDGFLQRVIDVSHQYGAVAIFDEVVTGFRFGLGGAQEYFGVTPDLTCLSKAIANGFPMGALVGKKEVMSVFDRDDFFVSGTFGGDIIGIEAAYATIETLARNNGSHIKSIWVSGEALRDGFNEAASTLDIAGTECIGFPPRTTFKFPSDAHRALFWQCMIREGFLIGYANFINAAHTLGVIGKTMPAIEMSLRWVKQHWQDPAAALEGKMPVSAIMR